MQCAGARLARVSLDKQFQTAQEPMDVFNQAMRIRSLKLQAAVLNIITVPAGYILLVGCLSFFRNREKIIFGNSPNLKKPNNNTALSYLNAFRF